MLALGNWQMSQLGGDLTFIQVANPREQSTAIGTTRGVVRKRTPSVDVADPEVIVCPTDFV